MIISFSCNSCGESQEAEGDLAGEQVRCGGCGELIQVPRPRNSGASPRRGTVQRITLRCRHCAETIEVAAERAGESIDCDHCGGEVVVPTPRSGHTADAGPSRPESEWPPSDDLFDPMEMNKDPFYASSTPGSAETSSGGDQSKPGTPKPLERKSYREKLAAIGISPKMILMGAAGLALLFFVPFLVGPIGTLAEWLGLRGSEPTQIADTEVELSDAVFREVARRGGRRGKEMQFSVDYRFTKGQPTPGNTYALIVDCPRWKGKIEYRFHELGVSGRMQGNFPLTPGEDGDGYRCQLFLRAIRMSLDDDGLAVSNHPLMERTGTLPAKIEPEPIALVPDSSGETQTEQTQTQPNLDLAEAIELLRNADLEGKRQAMIALLTIDVPAPERATVERLVLPLTESQDGLTLQTATRALRSCAGSYGVARLIDLVRHSDAFVRRHALESLGELKAEAAIESIVAVFEKDRATAATALRQIGGSAENAVLGLLTHDDRRVRTEAIKILGVIGSRASIDRLHRIDSDRATNALAQATIAEIETRLEIQPSSSPEPRPIPSAANTHR